MLSFLDVWLTRLANSPAARRTAGRFLFFSAIPYFAYFGLMILVAGLAVLIAGGGAFIVVMLAVATLFYCFPYVMFNGDAALLIGVPVSILIGGLVAWISRRQSKAPAFAIYIAVAAVASITVQVMLEVSGDPWQLKPRGDTL